jgi:phospholipase/carboxylesterase
MAVMSEAAQSVIDPVSDQLGILVPPLLRTLDTLATIGRRMHPPRIAEVVGLLGDRDATLDDAAARFRSAFWPSRFNGLRDQLGEAADLALSACVQLRRAASAPAGDGGGFRGLGYNTLAVEALYPVAEYVPAVSEWFVSPAQREDDALLERLMEPAAPGTGVLHVRNDLSRRGGYSVFVPEYVTPDLTVPVVLAMHGGSGHGRTMLWTWVREARSRGFIVIAPTSTGRTWDFADPGADIAHIEGALADIRSRWSIDPQRMLLTGISDGGTFTFLGGLIETSPFTHLAPIAASFSPVLLEISDASRLDGLPIYLIHGTLDWMFNIQVARLANNVLGSAGASVTFREIRDLSHTYPTEENELIIDWLNGPVRA